MSDDAKIDTNSDEKYHVVLDLEDRLDMNSIYYGFQYVVSRNGAHRFEKHHLYPFVV